MLNLLEFYKKNIKQDDYYYRFYNQLVTAPEKSKLELAHVEHIYQIKKLTKLHKQFNESIN